MSRNRSRSRSPIHFPDEKYEIESSVEDDDNDSPPSANCREFRIENFPEGWTFKEIKQFIKDRTNSSVLSDDVKYVKVVKRKDYDRYTKSLVKFSNPNICRQAYTQLKTREHEKIKDHTIYIKWASKSSEQDRNTPRTNNQTNINRDRRNNKKPTLKPTATQMSHDTYGLSSTFLDIIGVKLPLLNKVFVANLDNQVDETKLKEVFGHAGQILDVYLFTKENKSKMAKIEYDHPLEAVQAISMFHNQKMYGRMLIVQMDNSPTLRSKPLPAGLETIGPGLGPDGEPIRALRFVAELQPLKEFVQREITKLKAMITPMEQSNQSDSGISLANSTLQSMTPLNINTMNPYNPPALPVPNPFANEQGNQSLQMLQGLLQQNAFQAQSMAPNLVGFAQNYGTGQEWTAQTLNMGQMQTQSALLSDNNGSNKSSGFDKLSKNSEESDRKLITNDMLVFNNLPPSVTLSALRTKMREVGALKFIEVTGEGKAIVRFECSQDAERCVKLFDRSKVDGQLIHVRFF